MPKEIVITNNHRTGLFDSDTEDPCTPEKVYDVTDECPAADEQNRCLLIYTRAKRGRIVQIRTNCDGEDDGLKIHFFVDELEGEMNVSPEDDTFGLTAKRIGLSKSDFRKMIERLAPAI